MGIKSFKRRDFFISGLKYMGFFGAGGAVYTAYRFMSADNLDVDLHAPGPEAVEGGLVGSQWVAGRDGSEVTSVELGADSIPPGVGRIVAIGYTPVIVVNGSDGFRAFNATCSHLGCLVKWDGSLNRFVCPCHAGTYDADGRVVSGPPPMALRKCGVEVEGDKLVISIA
jgi:cytochrome b6-f complex iron-sulfur subunit